jgi:hypothetical protein
MKLNTTGNIDNLGWPGDVDKTVPKALGSILAESIAHFPICLPPPLPLTKSKLVNVGSTSYPIKFE